MATPIVSLEGRSVNIGISAATSGSNHTQTITAASGVVVKV